MKAFEPVIMKGHTGNAYSIPVRRRNISLTLYDMPEVLAIGQSPRTRYPTSI
jgi:hypothetical protein